MSVRRSRSSALFLILAAVGCAGAPQRFEAQQGLDDFGEPLETGPINEQTVGESQMLHRRWQLELRGGLKAPAPIVESNEFETGPLLGVKADIEVTKNLFFGLTFDWTYQGVDQGVSTLVDDPRALAGATPDQLFDHIHRYNLLANFDYDVVLVPDTIGPNRPLIFRFGAGLGAVLVNGIEDPQTTFDIEPYYGFLARPAVGLRWQFLDSMLLFGELSYDFVAPYSIDAKFQTSSGSDRAKVDGDIDFSAVNLIAGLAFEF